jgi:DNA-binding MarR family transcriptional regulator
MEIDKKTTLEIRILTTIILKTSTQALEKRLAEKDTFISRLQFGLLHLVSHQNYTISELSRKMMLDPSTLVPAVDALEQKGLLRRERDRQDRRRYPLYLTEAGESLLGEMHIINDDDPLLIALQTLGEADSEQLRILLRKVVESLPEGEHMLCEMEDRLKATLHKFPK